MVSLVLSLSLAVFAHAAKVPDACRNVAAYDTYMQGNTAHLKPCSENAAAIDLEFTNMKTSAQQVVHSAKQRNGGTQADALNNVSADAGARSETVGDWSKIASDSETKFNGMSDSLDKQVKQIDRETAKIAPALSDSQRTNFLRLSAAARKDFTTLQGSAQNHASAANKLSTQFRGSANDLSKYGETNKDAADRLNGGGQQQPVAVKTSSKNVLLGIGGGLLITGAAVGGLYWVSQKAIKSANDDGAARIAQAQAAANNVIANAGATATAVITAAQTAAQNIIQFATNSVNTIIANAAAAANAIYDKAKADINALKAELTSEVNAEFQYLTSAGLGKLQGELSSMFGGLISRAQSEGNSTLVASLQSTLAGLQSQIQTEISRRGSSTSSTVATSSATGSSTSTSVSTNTSVSTSSSISTSTGTDLSVHRN
jgi:F0F1-type ATP synthase membrane subunit b/b'